MTMSHNRGAAHAVRDLVHRAIETKVPRNFIGYVTKTEAPIKLRLSGTGQDLSEDEVLVLAQPVLRYIEEYGSLELGDSILLVAAHGDHFVGTAVLPKRERVPLLTVHRAPLVVLTFANTVHLDASAGEYFKVNATDGRSFAIANPTNPPGAAETQRLSIEVENSSGGVMGTISWGGHLTFPNGWTNPADGDRRVAHFVWNGGGWIAGPTSGGF